MKDYPHIARSTGQNFQEFKAMVFDKVDGSNIRFEWSRKRGWYKVGSRTRLLDTTDAVLGPAIPLFHATLAEPLERIAIDHRWNNLIVFTEFWGPGSLAGRHCESAPKELSLFDACPDKRGFLGPAPFMQLFGDLSIARYLGTFNWTRNFVERVYRGEVADITFEGVVGKAGNGHNIIRAKAKTKAWHDAIYARFGPEEGKRIVES